MTENKPIYKLSPSDFAYLYEDCKFCYCLKVKEGLYQPSMPMPGVFGAINTRLQGNMIGKSLKDDIAKELPDGKVITQEGWVESVVVPGTSVYIKGKYDILSLNPDGKTHTLVDLKLSQPGEDKIDKYKTQLTAYKFALENPRSGKPIKTNRLGLLVFYPDQVSFKDNTVQVTFPPKWLEVPIDEERFLTFAKEIDQLLSGPMPEPGKNCKWCQYRAHFAKREAPKKVQEELPF